MVADWQPEPHHQAFTSVLNGGIIGTLLDCHCNWTAAYHLMRRRGADKPPTTVDGRLPRPAAEADADGRPGPTSGARRRVDRRPGDGRGRRSKSDGVVTATCRGDVRGGQARPSRLRPLVSRAPRVGRAARPLSSSGAVAHQVVAGAREDVRTSGAARPAAAPRAQDVVEREPPLARRLVVGRAALGDGDQQRLRRACASASRGRYSNIASTLPRSACGADDGRDVAGVLLVDRGAGGALLVGVPGRGSNSRRSAR